MRGCPHLDGGPARYQPPDARSFSSRLRRQRVPGGPCTAGAKSSEGGAATAEKVTISMIYDSGSLNPLRPPSVPTSLEAVS